MKKIYMYLPLFAVTLFTACNNDNQSKTKAPEKQAVIFSKGERNASDNFVGTVYVHSLIEGDSLNQNSVGNVTFEPGARSKWHTHPAGQILLVTDGVGYYQEKDRPKVIIRKGDVIKCPPNTPHWHGASVDTAFVQIAITGREKGPTLWLDAVTDEEYNGGDKD